MLGLDDSNERVEFLISYETYIFLADFCFITRVVTLMRHDDGRQRTKGRHKMVADRYDVLRPYLFCWKYLEIIIVSLTISLTWKPR